MLKFDVSVIQWKHTFDLLFQSLGAQFSGMTNQQVKQRMVRLGQTQYGRGFWPVSQAQAAPTLDSQLHKICAKSMQARSESPVTSKKIARENTEAPNPHLE